MQLSVRCKGIPRLPLVARDDSVTNMKLPRKAKLVFKGKIFSVYQWPQKLYDGSTAIFEMLKRLYTVQVIPTIGDKILISKQIQPQHKKYFYSLFGGRIDGKETPLQAAKRELLEEAGLISNDWELFDTNQPLQKMDWTIYTYIARNCKKTKNKNPDAGEKIKTIALTFKQFTDLIFNNDFRGQNIMYEIVKAKLQGKEKRVRKKMFGK